MKTFTEIFNESSKPKVLISTDNFTNVLGEADATSQNFKINIEDDFLNDGILALYKVGANKYSLKFEISDKAEVNAQLSGISSNLIKFLLDIMEMTYDKIKEKYPKLDFASYEKLNK